MIEQRLSEYYTRMLKNQGITTIIADSHKPDFLEDFDVLNPPQELSLEKMHLAAELFYANRGFNKGRELIPGLAFEYTRENEKIIVNISDSHRRYMVSVMRG